MRLYLFVAAIVLNGFSAAAGVSEAKSPEDSLAAIRVVDGLTVELVACEPDVFDPVALCFDNRGRMYVIEDRGYPTGPGEGKPPAGSVALLDDTDGDGQYETRTTFAEELSFPNGIMTWKGGVIVTDAPHVLYFEDTDADGKADIREILLEGFAEGGSTQLRVSHPTLGPDNWIHFTNGLSGGKVRSPRRPDVPAVDMGGMDLRWNPITDALEVSSGQAQFGLTFDDFGHKFVCSNRKHIELVMLQPGDLARSPHAALTQTIADIPEHGQAAKLYPLSSNMTTAYSHTGTFTAACGLHIYRGDALPEAYRGNGFVCDPTGNLIHRDVLEVAGPALVAKRGEHEREFLASTDDWFRPVFITTGPDGALYFCDMYRKTIEHPTYLPPEIAAKTDFDSGKDRGRIYRVVGSNARRDALRVSRVGGLAVQELIERLGDSNGWVRDRARQMLLEQHEPAHVPMLEKTLAGHENALARAAVLSLLHSLGRMSDSTVVACLSDSDAMVRARAATYARDRVGQEPALADALIERASDPDARVRFAVALALGDSRDARAIPALSSILARDIDDPWIQTVVLSGVAPHYATFVETLMMLAAPPHDLARRLGRMTGSSEPVDRVAATLTPMLAANDFTLESWRMTYLLGVLDGALRAKAFAGPEPALQQLTKQGVQTGPIIAVARSAAGAKDVKPDALLNAIEFLGHTAFEESGAELTALLSESMSDNVRIAVVQALSRMNHPNVAAQLSNEAFWTTLTPPVRPVVIDALVRTTDRIPALLDAIEGGSVPPWSLDAAQRKMLVGHAEDSIRGRAVAIFEKATRGSRAEAYEAAKAALAMTPDPEKGKAVFESLCANCHIYQGIGNGVGPELSDVRAQPAEAILKHIVDPNSEVTTGFEAYTVEMLDGETYSGIIAAQSEATVTVRQALGIEHTLARSEIARIDASPLSLMPEDLEKGMQAQDLCNLIGFLKQ